MKENLEALFAFDRQLLGKGYDDALNWIDKQIGLDIMGVKSGKQFGTWTVPDEWRIKDAWVKLNGKKILDYKKNPLSVSCYSLPVNKKVSLKTLKNHIKTNPDEPKKHPYAFNFYEHKWEFTMPHNDFKKLKDGKYEVFIDSELVPGEMKIGIHTIPGKTKREILLFAHLDHPYQANDNLSAVVCLMDLVKGLKCEHTIKLVFCPETIGSIAYANTADISKVDAVIAVDICGNDNDVLLQLPWDKECRFAQAATCAMAESDKSYRRGQFRSTIGSDEYVFNDPLIGIPGIMLSTHPYPEYHTEEDTPDKINYEKIKEVRDLVKTTIDIYEKDYIPQRLVNGPLMRSRYKIETPYKNINLSYDYVWYSIDGKTTLSELCAKYTFPFNTLYDVFEKLIKDEKILRVGIGEEE